MLSTMVALMVAALLAVGLLPLFSISVGLETRAAASYGSITVLTGSTKCHIFHFTALSSIHVHYSANSCKGKNSNCTYSNDDFLSFHRSVVICLLIVHLTGVFVTPMSASAAKLRLTVARCTTVAFTVLASIAYSAFLAVVFGCIASTSEFGIFNTILTRCVQVHMAPVHTSAQRTIQQIKSTDLRFI